MKAHVDLSFTHTQLSQSISETLRAYASAMAHDQRTPISCIKISTDLLKDLLQKLSSRSVEVIDRELITDFESCIEILDDSTTRMISIIDNSLDNINDMFCTHKATLKNRLINFTKHNINDLFRPDMLRLIFINNDSKLVHINIKHSFMFMGDQLIMQQIITNILQNAFYQIRKNGRGEIFITTDVVGNENILKIKDTAGGASTEVLEHIFEANFTTKHDGNGVGLFFCKQAIQHIGGDIIAISEYGKYIEFILKFPRL